MEYKEMLEEIIKETERVLEREMTELEKSILSHGINLFRLELIK